MGLSQFSESKREVDPPDGALAAASSEGRSSPRKSGADWSSGEALERWSRRVHVRRLFLRGVFAFLVIGSVIRLPAEISRWYLASAKNAYEDSDFERAIERSTRGRVWAPDPQELLATRGMARFESGDASGALEDFDAIIANAAEDGIHDELDYQAAERKANVLLRMRRFSECIAIWDQYVDQRRVEFEKGGDPNTALRYALALNSRAYMQALGQIRLPDALTDIEKAISLLEDLDVASSDPALLDTLGYLLLLNQQPEQGAFYLERAVAIQEHSNQSDLVPRLRQMLVSETQLERFLEEAWKQFSIILHHRGEAYLAMGEELKGAADIKRSLQLGYDPDKGIW